MTDLTAFWSYLSEGPLLWLALTLLAYAAGDACFRASGRKPYVNTVLVAVAIPVSYTHLTLPTIYSV